MPNASALPSPAPVLLAASFGGLAVLLGAFAAHALKAQLGAAELRVFETGVRYQMYHALALGLTGLLPARGRAARIATAAFTIGIVLFSGSLYGLAVFELRWLGPITPIGGTAFVAGWIALGCAGRTPQTKALADGDVD